VFTFYDVNFHIMSRFSIFYWIICSKKLKVGDIFILYCIVLIYKFDLKNSIGQLIHIRMLSYDMSYASHWQNIQFSPWYSWKLARLTSNNNHSLIPLTEISYLGEQLVNFLVAIKLSSDFLQYSNIYKLSENHILIHCPFHCSC
jgi:hypothetical protein